ncbi:hypothetical protein KEM55_001186, partial [Ascosphaera atra]
AFCNKQDDKRRKTFVCPWCRVHLRDNAFPTAKPQSKPEPYCWSWAESDSRSLEGFTAHRYFLARWTSRFETRKYY